MRNRFASILLPGLAAFTLASCSSAPSQRRLAQDAAAAMGGVEKLQAVTTLSMKGGTGTRLRLGQTVKASDAESPAELKNVVEIVDLAQGRASLDYELQLGSFGMHRHEILTKSGGKPVGIEIVGTRPIIATSPGGLFSWGTQNSPEFLLKRNIVSIALAGVESASDSQPAEDKSLNGQMYKFAAAKTKDGQDVALYFDPQTKLLAAYEVIDTESMLGDVTAQYLLRDYKTADGLTLPHRITIRKGGKDYSEVQFTSIAVNEATAADVFNIPESAAAEVQKVVAAAEYSPITITKVGNGVYHAQGYSHHSMLVEFPTFLALMDAPYTETQTKVLWEAIEQQFPMKPVKYVGVSHHHYDHIGGVRGAAAMGATVLLEKRQEPVLRPILEARYTHPQDELARRTAEPPSIEVYEGKKVISEGGQSFELYGIASPHVDPMVLGYASSARALFQPDIYTPPSTMPAGPAAVHMAQSIKELKLRVDTMVGGHGGIGTYADFLKAAQ